MIKTKYLALFAFVGISTLSQAQSDAGTDAHTVQITIPSVALVDIEPSGSKDIAMAFAAPTEAGNPITAPTANTTLWLNYSSIVASTGVTSRRINVKVSSGAIPAGTNLTVQAAAASGSGGGTVVATGSSVITLTDTDQSLLTGIGSAYTGNGANNGHQLTYNLALASGGYANLKSDASTTVTVTYTIADN